MMIMWSRQHKQSNQNQDHDAEVKFLWLQCCNEAYMLLKETITVVEQVAGAAAIAADKNKKQVMFKNCAPFSDCISELNNTEVDNAQDLDVVISFYNVIKYSDNHTKTSGCLRQYSKDDPNNNTDSQF